MSACSGCGGVVGIDCFRPSECEEASEDMERRQLAYQVETLRAQLEAAERYKVAFEEWHAKTEWVQETAQPRDLGRHLADVLRARIEAAEARAEAAEANAARLLDALEEIANQDAAFRPGWIHWAQMARNAIDAARAKRNLRSMIERGSDDRELMLKCLEDLS